MDLDRALKGARMVLREQWFLIGTGGAKRVVDFTNPPDKVAADGHGWCEEGAPRHGFL